MEAALLSNTLHQYRDDDVDGARSVIGEIMEKRAEWTRLKKDIAYFDKTGKLPESYSTGSPPEPTSNPAGLAEQRLELARLNSNISKHQKKIADNPEHKKVERWKEDLAKLAALKEEVKQTIVNLTYAAT